MRSTESVKVFMGTKTHKKKKGIEENYINIYQNLRRGLFANR